LDRLRSIPGLRIGGVGERDAQVYLRGQTSIKYYQEVVFYVNGARVGNYSSAYQVVQPENIDSIKLLKSASELSLYGSDGRDGVILIKTKN
jgi:TonB-dependent SusC/RagA subfamily outer membrane receptor